MAACRVLPVPSAPQFSASSQSVKSAPKSLLPVGLLGTKPKIPQLDSPCDSPFASPFLFYGNFDCLLALVLVTLSSNPLKNVSGCPSPTLATLPPCHPASPLPPSSLDLPTWQT